MTPVSRLGLGLVLGVGALLVLGAIPEQGRAREAAPQGPVVSKAERAALSALKSAIDNRDYVGAGNALRAAQSAAGSSDARYYVATLQFRLGRESGNAALQASAIDAMIASGRVPQGDLGGLYASQGILASQQNDRQRAESALTRALELAPRPETAIALARTKIDLRKNAEAVALVDRAIALQAATGQPAPESWYRRGISVATMSSLGPQALKLSREWVAAYPSPENWRDAILTYRDVAKPDPAAQLDSTRLMRLAKGLAGERDYLEAAQAFNSASLPGEARSLFEEGVASRMVDPAKATFKEAIATAARAATAAKARLPALRTGATAAASGAASVDAGDQFLSFGDYRSAADLYQSAVRKGGADPDVANMRLGIALALAGRRAEAEAAFRSVAGPRAELASLWLVWLAQRA